MFGKRPKLPPRRNHLVAVALFFAIILPAAAARAQEAASLTVSVTTDVRVNEGDEGQRTNLPFAVSLSGTPGHRVRVQITAMLGVGKGKTRGGGTATGDAGPERDFFPFQTEVFFEKGASGAALTRSLNVEVIGDNRVEPDETVTLRVNNLRTEDDRVVLANGKKRIDAVGTIIDDDHADSATSDQTTVELPAGLPLEISVTDAEAPEGDEGTTDLVFTVTLGGSPGSDVVLKAETVLGSPHHTVAATARSPADEEVKERDIVLLREALLAFEAGASGAALSKTVVVKILGDHIPEADETFTLQIRGLKTGDDRVAFAGGGRSIEATGTILNDDQAGVTLSKSALTIPEGGGDSYTVALEAQPTADVTIAVGGAAGDVTAEPAALTFTAENWRAPQTVTVSAAEDDDAAADTAVTLSHSASGGGYDAVRVASVEVDVTENDTAGVTLSKSALTIPEGGGDSYAVVLDTQPTADVTIAVGGAAGDVTAEPAALTFTAENWRAPQTVTVAAAVDDDAITDAEVTLTHRAAGGGYGEVLIDPVRVAVTENYSAEREAARKRDHVNRAILPYVIEAMGSSSAVKERVEAGGISGAAVASARFGAWSAASAAGSRNDPLPAAEPGSDLLGWTADPRSAARSGLSRGGWMVEPGPAADFGPGLIGSNPGDPRSPDRPASRLGDLFDGAGFALPLAAAGGGSAATTIWGRSEKMSFSGSEAGARWDGGLWTAHLGADFRARPDVLVGMAISHARSETDVAVADVGAGGFGSVYETEFTALNPYAAWILDDGSNLWASASYGAGKARVELDDAASRSADLRVARAEAGGRRVLAALPGLIAGGTTRFAVKGEGSLSRAKTGAELGLAKFAVDTARLRLALEGSHERELAEGGALTPAFEAGLRYDGGDVATGAGLEVGASLGWRNPAAGLTAEFRGRALVAHERDRDEWGLSALLRLDPGEEGRGGFLTLKPSWGATETETGVARLFDAAPASAFANGGAPLPAKGRMEAEYGYGLGVDRRGGTAMLSPYARLGLGEAGERALRFGAKYRLESAFSIEFELERRQDERIAPQQRLMLRGEYRW